jgi:hypothetical protein
LFDDPMVHCSFLSLADSPFFSNSYLMLAWAQNSSYRFVALHDSIFTVDRWCVLLECSARGFTIVSLASTSW